MQGTISLGALGPPSENIPFGPVGVAFTIPAALLLLLLPRRYALAPLVLTACWMTWGQQVVVGPFHFTIWRLMLLAGWLRVLTRGEFKDVDWRRQDTLICLWAITSVAAYTILLHSAEALVNRLGVIYNSAGAYYLTRCLIRNVSDFKRLCKMCSLALAPVALCMFNELRTGWNLFSILRGVPEMSQVREGLVRCQGPFRHPILAGTFGATWAPLFVGLWWQGRGNRLLAAVGFVAALSMVTLSGSSGPILTLFLGMLSLSLWKFAKRMRVVRWAIVLALLGLQVVMKDPVWFIFARINIVSGSTGWHRSFLIDQTIRHFFEWWLIGTPLERVAAWGVFDGDITNQYILEGLCGGLLTLVLFIWIIVIAFRTIGVSCSRTKQTGNEPASLFIWAAGASMVAHVGAFFSVSYFDQNLFNWYSLLAIIAVCGTINTSKDKSVPRERRNETLDATAVWHPALSTP